jgi:hypothetical protein
MFNSEREGLGSGPQDPAQRRSASRFIRPRNTDGSRIYSADVGWMLRLAINEGGLRSRRQGLASVELRAGRAEGAPLVYDDRAHTGRLNL